MSYELHQHTLPIHSFPTRRSSDLWGAKPFPKDSREGQFQLLASGNGDDNVLRINADARILGATDRKSTRLNPSHVEMSYAVFCLKKKTEQRRRLQDVARQGRVRFW